MRDRRTGVLVVTAALLVVVAVLTVAWATEKRRFVASAPQPPPLYETQFVRVRGGERACLQDATAVPRGEIAQFRVSTNGRRAVPLTFSMTGPGGYRTSGRVPPTYRDNDVVSVRVDPPPRPLFVRICIRNDGERRIDLFAAADESPTLDAEVGGEDADDIPAVRLLEADRGTIAGHASAIARQITVFRPGFVGTWLVWPLAVLVLVGLPAGVGWTLWRAAGRDG